MKAYIKMLNKTVAFTFLILTTWACGGGGGSISVTSSIEDYSQERFASKAVDILFVIDDSGSMRPVQDNLRANFGEFIAAFYSKGFNFRVAVVKTSAFGNPSVQNSGGTLYYEAGTTVHEFRCGAGNNCGAGPSTYGRACTGGWGDTDTTNGNGTPGPGTDHILSSSSMSQAQMELRFLRNADVGLCGTGSERTFQASEAVLRKSNSPEGIAAGQKFPREDAHFAVIHVGDEPDGKWSAAASSNGNGSLNAHNLSGIYKSSAGNTDQNKLAVQSYLDALDLHEPSATISVHAIQNLTSQCDPVRQVGHPQIFAAEITSGKQISICNDFAQDLSDLGDYIVQLASEFFLNSTDIIESTLRVFVDEVEIFRTENPQAAQGFMYRDDPARIIFVGDSVPNEGAKISVTFTGRYLR